MSDYSAPQTSTNSSTIEGAASLTQNEPCPRSHTRQFEPVNGSASKWLTFSLDQRAALSAQWTQQRHAAASVGAAIAGVGIIMARKGTQPHRIMGRIWTGAAVISSLNAFRLRDADGKFTWFHGLSALTLMSAAAGVYCARTKKIMRHKKFMGLAYASAVLAGVAVWATPGKTTPTSSS